MTSQIKPKTSEAYKDTVCEECNGEIFKGEPYICDEECNVLCLECYEELRNKSLKKDATKNKKRI